MLQPNEIYLNGNNSTVQIASAHETSEVMVYEHPLFGKVRMFVENVKVGFVQQILPPLCSMQIQEKLS